MTHVPPLRIVDLTADRTDLVDQTAVLLHESFRGRSDDWQDLHPARQEVLDSLDDEKISRVALGESDSVIGWVGGLPLYDGRVWEIHPIVVSERSRGMGVGRALLQDLETLVRARGALTLWAGSDDENGETSLSGVDLYADTPAALGNVQNLKKHPYGFFVRAGFRIVGVLPDANGRGKPDIFLAKRV